MSDIKSPGKAIRAFCLDCISTSQLVRDCPATKCQLYPFRFGKNPFRKPISEEQREKLRERAKETFGKSNE